MKLAHLGMRAEAAKIEAAALEAVRRRKTTSDIGGTMGTREVGEWVAGKVAGDPAAA
jgi:isocitrate/isopropylmalate dehydrogenase